MLVHINLRYSTYTNKHSSQRLKVSRKKLISNLNNNKEIFSRIALAYDDLILIKLGRFKRVGDRQSLPVIETRCSQTTSQIISYTSIIVIIISAFLFSCSDSTAFCFKIRLLVRTVRTNGHSYNFLC